MKWVFWAGVALVTYAYVGYLALLWVRSKMNPRPAMRGRFEPFISVVMVVRNERGVLAKKIRNLLFVDYPPEKLQIIVISDGSTDDTEAILREQARNPQVQVLVNQLPRGKAQGLNDGMSMAQGDIVFFTDARQTVEANALRLLMQNFADPQVGAASGELMLGHPASGETGRGMGLYWQIEKRVRELESATGSVVGATGAIYAVRRELVPELPPDTILDDVFIPLHVAKQGYRVVFDNRARAWDEPNLGAGREFRRKVRTLSGNYQLLQLAPWLLRNENPVRFALISHKLLRLIVPFALIAVLVSAWLVPESFYREAFWTQLGFYALSLLGLAGWKLGPLSRVSDIASTFVALNLAALVAFSKFVTGQKTVWMHAPVPKEAHPR
jgi:biofilm PGA synthesis N-glycosyltransferase PgaC